MSTDHTSLKKPMGLAGWLAGRLSTRPVWCCCGQDPEAVVPPHVPAGHGLQAGQERARPHRLQVGEQAATAPRWTH